MSGVLRGAVFRLPVSKVVVSVEGGVQVFRGQQAIEFGARKIGIRPDYPSCTINLAKTNSESCAYRRGVPPKEPYVSIRASRRLVRYRPHRPFRARFFLFRYKDRNDRRASEHALGAPDRRRAATQKLGGSGRADTCKDRQKKWPMPAQGVPIESWTDCLLSQPRRGHCPTFRQHHRQIASH